jgi:phosphoglycerate kinase
MKTIDQVNLLGKTVFVRIDVNCPVGKNLKIEKSERISAHAKTIRELSKKGAKVVILAHQGRKGDYDCISLKQHSILLSKEAKLKIKFVDDIIGQKAKSAISSLKNGEVLLLENVRFLDDETIYKTIEENASALIVKELSPYCDYFILDAFSVAHRPHASVVGFYQKEVLAGPVIKQELDALNKLKNPKKPAVFIFGGAKPEDSIEILEHLLTKGKISYALTCGVLGELFILASGKELGATIEYFKEKGVLNYLSSAKELLLMFGKKILFPKDVAIEVNKKRQEIPISALPCEHMIIDIGSKTISQYIKKISSAKTIMINGPAGIYEQKTAEKGTKALLDAISHSKGFSVIGGGHTISALAKFKISKKKIGYVSLSGKAFIEFLSGKELPGVKILE